MSELPTFGASAYSSTSTALNAMTAGTMGVGQMAFANNGLAQARRYDPAQAASAAFNKLIDQQFEDKYPKQPKQPEKQHVTARRLVQVLIADTDENIPLDSMVLYTGEQKLTDATDQELFFEVDINTLLKTHNERRVTFHDKSVKERVEKLEPAKIRDLKMVVVTVATF